MKHYKHLFAGFAFARALRATPLLLALALLPTAAQAQDIANGNINISGGSTTITGTSSTYRVTVTSGTSNITLQGVSITGGANDDEAPITVRNGANVTITLVGNNTLTAGSQSINAGLRVEPGATVTITSASSGNLTATGNDKDGCNGAGIGGMGKDDTDALNTGAIIITGNANVTANGSYRSAGIGSGGFNSTYKVYTGTITISGNATVNATGGSIGAGIGCGANMTNNGTVNISGGTVIANGGGFKAAGIGGGIFSGGGTINITGGVVTANGDNDAKAIGPGEYAGGGTFDMSGNAIVFTNANGVVDSGSRTSGILVIDGNLAANATVTGSCTVPSGKSFTIPGDKTLTIQNGGTLTNNATITNAGTITVQSGGTLTNSGTLTNNGTVTPADGSTVTVSGTRNGANKINGANVSGAPSLNDKTPSSITINSGIILKASTGQAIEYGISTTTNPADAVSWQTGLTFSGLSANTTYYIFARSKENTNFKAGAASAASGAIKTITSVSVSIQANGTENRATSTMLTLTFNQSVTGLSASNITLEANGGAATKGALDGSGTTYTLAISGVTQGDIKVSIADFGGFTVTNSPQNNVPVYEDKRAITGVGAQSDPLTYGAASSVTYSNITMTHFVNQTTTVSLNNAPAGVTGAVTVSGGVGTLTLTTLATTPAGAPNNISFMLDGKTSNTFTLTVGKKELTVTGIAFQNKTYNGTAAAIMNGTLSLVGVEPSDDGDVTINNSSVSYNFATANAGETTVNRSSNYTLDGAKAGNYSLTQPAASFPSSGAQITKKTITINGASIAAKTYNNANGATITGVTFTGDLDGLTLGTDFTATGVFTDVNAGTSNRTVAVSVSLGSTAKANNYTISNSPWNLTNQTISPAPIGSATVGVTGTYTYNATAQTPAAGDVTVELAPFGTLIYNTDYTFAAASNINAGTAAQLTVTGTGNFTGTAMQNFTIGKKTVSISGIAFADKPYDGTTAATMNGTLSLVGVEPSDNGSVTINSGGVSYNFATANAGETTVNRNGNYALDGAKAGNYALTQPAASFPSSGAQITRKQAVVVWGRTTFTYDGNPHLPTAQADTLRLVVATAQTDAGTHTATATSANTNYELTNATTPFVITKRVGGMAAIPEVRNIEKQSDGKYRVSIAPLASPTNGQTIEYALTLTQIAPAVNVWQSDAVFADIVPTDAGGYVWLWARSAENATHFAGQAFYHGVQCFCNCP